MAETVQYTGRLGLENRDSGTLSAAVTAVVDTLEDFGHPAEMIAARAENTARLQCDHYLVTVRLRRVPLRRTSKLPGSVMQPSALLELSLSPAYPGYCDQEISELLLAEVLRRLLDSVEATSVEWLDTEVALTCEQFLSVFDPQAAEKQPDTRPAAAVAPRAAKPVQAAEARPRGRDCFTPVDQTALALDAHCDRALKEVQMRKAARAAAAAAAATRPSGQPAAVLRSGWGRQLQATALAALSLGGARRLRFISHVLLVSALMLYLESAGMVLAARPLVP